ncbi:MAG: hypothetical protein DMG62_21850, partial [Acidobacteria bacterium]
KERINDQFNDMKSQLNVIEDRIINNEEAEERINAQLNAMNNQLNGMEERIVKKVRDNEQKKYKRQFDEMTAMEDRIVNKLTTEINNLDIENKSSKKLKTTEINNRKKQGRYNLGNIK